MAWYLVGDWAGTMYTDQLVYFPGIGPGGGPPLTQNVLFRISAQTESQYVNRDTGRHGEGYSFVSGQLYGADTEEFDTVISGLVDSQGLVELAFLYDPLSNQCIYFTGQFDIVGHSGIWPRGQISGNWTLVILQDGYIEYQVGTLSVSKFLSFPLSQYPVNPSWLDF